MSKPRTLIVLRSLSLLIICLICIQFAFGQGIQGMVTDANGKMPLIGVNVVVKGTTYGVSTDINGQYNLNRVPAGVYQIEVSYLGYEKKLFTGIRISADKPTRLDVSLAPSALTLDQEVVVVGEKPLVDIEQSKSEQRVSQESIENAPVRQLQGVLNTQAGVVLNPEGLSIRGGRTYETAFIIDGVSATDPLAGTGFGIDLGTNSVDGIDVTTGGGDVAYGDGTSGIVKTRTRSGGDRTEFSFNHRRDRLGFTNDWQSVWGNSIYEATAGGSLKGVLPRPLRVFASFKGSFDDQYFRRPADQVTSSLYPNVTFSPYQDNRWAGMLKFDYEFKPGMRLGVNYLRSLTINQDVNMLRIIGNDVPFLPDSSSTSCCNPIGPTPIHTTPTSNRSTSPTPRAKNSHIPPIYPACLYAYGPMPMGVSGAPRMWMPNSILPVLSLFRWATSTRPIRRFSCILVRVSTIMGG